MRTSLLSLYLISSPRDARRDDEHPPAVCHSSREERRLNQPMIRAITPVATKATVAIKSWSPAVPVTASIPPGRLCGGWGDGGDTTSWPRVGVGEAAGAVAEGVAFGVGVTVADALGVGDGSGVALGDGSGVGLGSGVGVVLGDGVGSGDGVTDGVGLGVGVGVDSGVGDGDGSGFRR